MGVSDDSRLLTTDWLVGRHAVTEAFHGGVAMEKIVVAAEIPPARWHSLQRLASQRSVPWQRVPKAWLDKLGQELGQRHQGVAARISSVLSTPIETMWERAKKSDLPPLFLLLDGVQDPHNLGAILRTAAAVGVHGVVIPKRRATGLTRAVLETSLGAVAHVPIARVANLRQKAFWLRKRGVWILGADVKASEGIYDRLASTFGSVPLALLIGGEGRGLRPSLRTCCDHLYRIPMRSPIASLNVSVATALFLYAVRYGHSKGDTDLLEGEKNT